MTSKILYIFTRTPLHVGAGSSVGAIDQPIQRERHTGFPVIPGSSIKGVLADGVDYLSRENYTRTDLGCEVFGHDRPEDKAAKSGGVSIGEAKVLAFPVRSARGCFAWVTCPLVLERWSRESGVELQSLPKPKDNESFHEAKTLGTKAIFEDYPFFCAGGFDLAAVLSETISDKLWSGHALDHLALVSNETFSHFVTTCCDVAQHVKISDETGTAADGALFNQENVPSETLFFSGIAELRSGVLEHLKIPTALQIGADATTGLGFCSTELK